MSESAQNEVVSGITALVYVGVGALVLLVVIGSMSSLAGGPFTAHNQSMLFTPGEWTQIDARDSHDVQSVDRVVESTGYAIRLTGSSDSYWQTTQSVDVADDSTWTACTWASVDSAGDGKNRTMTALSANGRVLIQYNGTDGNWSAWYYDDETTNSYRVNISAPNQPGNLTHVCAWHNGSQFRIYRNATAGETEETMNASMEGAGLDASHWDGQQDEVRTFDEALNASQRNATFQYPTRPVVTATRTARVYFDSGSGTTEPVFFAAGSATLSNVSWTPAGWDGQVLDHGQDYALSADRDGLRVFSSSSVAEAPTIWITYSGSDAPMVGPVVTALSPGIGLLAVLGIVLVAVIIFRQLPAHGREQRRRRPRR